MKWSQIKRTISLALCVLMVLALLPTSTLAEDTAVPTATPAPTETATSDTGTTPAPVSTQTSESQATPTPTPTPSESSVTGEATPVPSEPPLTDAIPEEPVTHIVNFVIDGATMWGMQQKVVEGETVVSPGTPAVPEGEAYAGQMFLYWHEKNHGAYNFSTPVTSDLTLYAEFGPNEEAPKTEEEPAVTEEEPVVTEEEPIVADGDIPFSMFSMAGGILPETTPLWTYTFVVDGVTIDTKIVANGDSLDAPQAPEAPEGQTFKGWYTNGDTLFDAFGAQTVTEDGATTLTAKFETAYYVFFYNQFGSVFKTVLPDASNVVSMPSSSELQVATNEAIVGWSLTSDGLTPVGSTVTVDGANINLYPIIQNVVWITFNSIGGTYISPMYIMPNTPLTQSAVNSYVASQNGGSSTITKPGYTFANWAGFTFGNTPTSSVTLTANWMPNNNTPYKLVYWIENADNTGYSFEKSVDKTGTTGTAIAPSPTETATSNLNASYAAYFNTGTYTTGQTIKGDGSSILNIYHTRKTYTLTYKNGYNTIYNQTYKYDQGCYGCLERSGNP